MRLRAWSVVPVDEGARTIRSYEHGDPLDSVFVVREAKNGVVWVVSRREQGPIQAFRNRDDADEFCRILGGAPIFRVNSLALVEQA